MWPFSSKQHQASLSINGSDAFDIGKKETILDAALRQGFHVPHSCRVGGCGTCKCKLKHGKVREFTDTSYLLSKQELQENYILACQTRAKDAVVVDFPGWNKAAKPVSGKLLTIEELTHDIFELTIELEEAISFLPGQYMRLSPADGSLPARCYSFANVGHPENPKIISFFIRRVEGGNMSNWLTDPAHIGETLIAEGPNGEFYLRDIDGPAIFIAGGSGLAPILSVLEGAIEKSHKVIFHDALFLFGAREQRDLYALDRIEKIRQGWGGHFAFKAVLSAVQEDSDWAGAVGMVTEHIPDTPTSFNHAYLCGPPPMLDAAIDVLVSRQLNETNIYLDKFSDQSSS